MKKPLLAVLAVTVAVVLTPLSALAQFRTDKTRQIQAGQCGSPLSVSDRTGMPHCAVILSESQREELNRTGELQFLNGKQDSPDYEPTAEDILEVTGLTETQLLMIMAEEEMLEELEAKLAPYLDGLTGLINESKNRYEALANTDVEAITNLENIVTWMEEKPDFVLDPENIRRNYATLVENASLPGEEAFYTFWFNFTQLRSHTQFNLRSAEANLARMLDVLPTHVRTEALDQQYKEAQREYRVAFEEDKIMGFIYSRVYQTYKDIFTTIQDELAQQ